MPNFNEAAADIDANNQEPEPKPKQLGKINVNAAIDVLLNTEGEPTSSDMLLLTSLLALRSVMGIMISTNSFHGDLATRIRARLEEDYVFGQ